MVKSGGRAANFLLRWGSLLSGLRGIPILGGFLSWGSRQLVPTRTLIWAQIKHGPAQGLWIRVNPRTGQNFQQGIVEPAVQLAMQRLLHPGMTFYDLGANIGFFSLMAARLVGPSGSVISFEADPEIASRLRENLIYNKFHCATVEEKAIWSESMTVSFARVDSSISPDRGLGHVSDFGSANSNSIPVEAISLDQFILSHIAPDFLKCDVEGAEVAVFQGAELLLREKRPILLVEMHNSENQRVLTQKFSQLGYACSSLDDNHVLALPQ